jgi:hypothetical protein
MALLGKENCVLSDDAVSTAQRNNRMAALLAIVCIFTWLLFSRSPGVAG